MYEMAKKGREAMKAKARRLASEKDSKVDSSDWTPAEPMNADVKTGMRPVSRKAYKTGGKVMGEACAPRADRKPRKAGGKTEATEYALAKVNRNVKEANEEREGKKHVGGMKSGGRAYKNAGGFIGRGTLTKDGKDVILPTAPRATPNRPTPPLPPKVPPRAADPGMSAQEAEEFMKSRKTGGRTKKAAGGVLNFKGDPVIPGMKKGGKAKHADEAEDKALIKKMERTERKRGGRVGKTNINIVIATKPGDGAAAAPGMTAPGMPRPPGGVPVPVPAPAPAPAAAPMPMPMPMPGPAPMARKRGGRVAKSYKDMTAGAGSGLGRLQKTEIQANKR